MPPAQFGKVLSDSDRQLFRRWIEQGAKWEGHWAFLPISRPQPPAVKPGRVAKNDVDRFILQALDEHGLQPSPEADPVTLLRRLRFDLTGLPPSTEEVDAFVADPSEKAYEKVVDRLLGSPQFGERMAMWWLDLVRYADSVGYHGDQPISVFPFRDYVIKSFNENKPFDRFTLEQLAGDLLPEPTVEDKVASGYNRLGMMSAEGGVQPKEYLSKYIAERVRNVSGTWLGATFGCCECHNHKFDPFLAKDFYSLGGVFCRHRGTGTLFGAPTATAVGVRASSFPRRRRKPSGTASPAKWRLSENRSTRRRRPSPLPSERGSTKSTRSFRRESQKSWRWPGTSDRTPSGRNWPPITARSRRRSMRRAKSWRTSSAPQPACGGKFRRR